MPVVETQLRADLPPIASNFSEVRTCVPGTPGATGDTPAVPARCRAPGEASQMGTTSVISCITTSSAVPKVPLPANAGNDGRGTY